MAPALVDSIFHWKRKLDKDPDDDYILNVIRKLSKVLITREILEVTHIGKTIRKLSKRDDIVGEKAKTVLKKWREAFINQGSDINQLPYNSKKENVNNESKASSKFSSHENTVHSLKPSSHYEYKQKSYYHSLSPSLTEQFSKKYVNGSYKVNSSSESSHSLYKYDVKERNGNYLDYDPHTESSEGYNPECPELFPTDKPVKTKKSVLVETYEPSLVKRKLTDEIEQNEQKSCYKKLKSGHSSSDIAADSKKSSEKKDKHSLNKEKAKDNSYYSTLKKESYEAVLHSAKKYESETDCKKTNCREFSQTDGSKSKKPKVILSSEEFTSSEVSFEDCLGFNDFFSLKKSSKLHGSAKKLPFNSNPFEEKRTEKSKQNPSEFVSPDQKAKVSKDSWRSHSLHGNRGKVSQHSAINNNATKVSKPSFHSSSFVVPKPPNMNIADVISSSLPDIQPVYRPLPRRAEFHSSKKKVLSNEEAIKFMSSKREKTAVYSGKKSNGYIGNPQSLFKICTKVLIDNIEAIECVGDASYEIMEPVLERCTPQQLMNIEKHNPKFVDETNLLWEKLCRNEYKMLNLMEHETWREFYWRTQDERIERFEKVTANINRSMASWTPARKVKLAYIDGNGYIKPPRDVARTQMKNGTGGRINSIVKQNLPPKQKIRHASASASSSTSSSVPKKPKLAPLMAKTLKSLKALRRK